MKMLASPSQALGDGLSSLKTETEAWVVQSQRACERVKHWGVSETSYSSGSRVVGGNV